MKFARGNHLLKGKCKRGDFKRIFIFFKELSCELPMSYQNLLNASPGNLGKENFHNILAGGAITSGIMPGDSPGARYPTRTVCLNNESLFIVSGVIVDGAQDPSIQNEFSSKINQRRLQLPLRLNEPDRANVIELLRKAETILFPGFADVANPLKGDIMMSKSGPVKSN